MKKTGVSSTNLSRNTQVQETSVFSLNQIKFDYELPFAKRVRYSTSGTSGRVVVGEPSSGLYTVPPDRRAPRGVGNLLSTGAAAEMPIVWAQVVPVRRAFSPLGQARFGDRAKLLSFCSKPTVAVRLSCHNKGRQSRWLKQQKLLSRSSESQSLKSRSWQIEFFLRP